MSTTFFESKKVKKSKVSLTAKIMAIVTAFLLVMDVAIGFALVSISSARTKEVLDHKMFELALTASNLVNGDEIKGLTIADKENDTPAYRNNYNILASFKTNKEEFGADLAYIYCLQKVDDVIVYSIDVDPVNPADFLTESPDPITEGMIAAFNGELAIDNQAYTDEWGFTYSAYAPIFASDKSIAGVIGIDVWGKWYNDQVTSNIIAISVSSAVTLTAGVLISLLITLSLRKKFRNITNEMNSLEIELKTLLQEIRKSENNHGIVVEKETGQEPDVENKDGMMLLKDKIVSVQKELKQYIDYNEQKAYTDSLTKLNNRLSYFERVKAINSRIKERTEEDLIVLIYDMNGLKDINDTYGHEFGDLALVYSANLVKEVYGEENVYRIGGDEYVIILENIKQSELALKDAEFDKKLKEFNKTKTELKSAISLSRGSASYNKLADKEFIDVFRKADRTMYRNKTLFYEGHKNT